MALQELVELQAGSTITDEDRISHTTKQAERTFGASLAELGTVEIVDGRAVLVVEHNGKRRQLHWSRSPRAHIQWFVDGGDKPLALSQGKSVLANLLRELGS